MTLEVSHLSVGYDELVLERFNLTVADREIVAILGASGSGKSTLLAAIAGVQTVQSGSIILDGQDITEIPVHQRGVGLVFQEPLLFPHLNVRDNVAYGLRRHGVAKKPARERADELLGWVGLPGFGPRLSHELSGGQAQRVALARALAPSPRLLLLDEPFSALDVDLRQRLAMDVVDIVKGQGISAIHVTHDPAEADAIADRVIRLGD